MAEQNDHREGVEVYVVGGFVRDHLLGLGDKDIDILVIGDGVQFARTVGFELDAHSVLVFERFGTAMMMVEQGKIEFVGSRSESYAPESRKPRVKSGTLEEDLLRRDFTVNALAVRLNAEHFGELHDPFNGRTDLATKVLRTPLDPVKTFEDDPLRIMRAIRFASQTNF
jgi:tRNA nucleotidyltransferase/poly(A) polymerase